MGFQRLITTPDTSPYSSCCRKTRALRLYEGQQNNQRGARRAARIVCRRRSCGFAFPLNPRTSLGNQLEQIAKVISVRNELGMSRQIFFCSLGGFDTHSGQVTSATSPTTGTHADLLLQVSNAMKAFYDATVQLGVASQVTTFTLSDFSRTWVPNGNLGTDHAWGSHQFVMGGSVRGGDFYGLPTSNGTVFPTLVAGAGDDTDNGSSARGRFVPSVAVDQFGATLASWFGVSDADLPAVFPNINNFGAKNLFFL